MTSATAAPDPPRRGRGRPRTLPPGTVTTTVRLPPDLLAEVGATAAAADRSINDEIIRRCRAGATAQGDSMDTSTRNRTTGELVTEAFIAPDRCNHCGAHHPGMVTRVDDDQLRGKGDWTWQCQGCGQLVHLTRETIVKRWRQWRDE